MKIPDGWRVVEPTQALAQGIAGESSQFCDPAISPMPLRSQVTGCASPEGLARFPGNNAFATGYVERQAVGFHKNHLTENVIIKIESMIY